MRIILNLYEWGLACHFMRIASSLLNLTYDTTSIPKVPTLASLVESEALDPQELIANLMRVSHHLTETILVMTFRKLMQSIEAAKHPDCNQKELCHFVKVIFQSPLAN